MVFTYGPVKGSAAVSVPLDPALPCAENTATPEPCPVRFEMQFADLDASLLESALLGAQQKTTLLSDLIDRLHPSASPPWPAVEGTIKADSLILGPVTLHGVSAGVRLEPTGAEISSLDAGLFGGSVHVSGSLVKPASDKEKPAYTFEGDFQKLNVTQLGGLLGLRWSGTALDGNGKIDLSGYTAKELAASAQGTLHFECRRGAVGNQPSESSKAEPVPAALGRFDQWSGDAAISNGSITLGESLVTSGARKQSVAAAITFGDPPVVSFTLAKLAASKHD